MEAKARGLEHMKMETHIKTSTKALYMLTDAQPERTAPCVFESPDWDTTREAPQYRGVVMRKMLSRAGVL